ncbi:MAG TPA: SdrD B-like domain-containing protein [Candidatus Methanoperedens sp.]
MKNSIILIIASIFAVAAIGIGVSAQEKVNETIVLGDNAIMTASAGETIHGTKFNDINGNKMRDLGDEGLANWTIRLKGFDTLTRTTVDKSVITDANGNYSFINLTPGFYTVFEELQPRWVPTTSPARSVRLIAGEMVVDFGNRRADIRALPPTITINITEPVDGVIFNSLNLPRLRGHIVVPEGLSVRNFSNVIVEVKNISSGISYSADITEHVLQDSTNPKLFTFAVNNLRLFEGENNITVLATATARVSSGGIVSVSSRGSVRVAFGPPDSDLNIYVLGIEITQAIQGDENWNGVAGMDPAVTRSSTPLPRIPYQDPFGRKGVPLVAHKSTIVRVYGAIEGTPGAVHGVPARLIAVHGAPIPIEIPLEGYITLDPADNVKKTDGSLDVEKTLEKKRSDLDKSWNFILPDGLTSGIIGFDYQVFLNPPDLSGPSECPDCNDEANKLTVSNIQFSKTASLSIRSFYVLGDGKEKDSDKKVFCGGFLNMYPVRDGCATGPTDSNDLDFGINLLALESRTMRDSRGNLILDGGIWQDQMCKLMVSDRFGSAMPRVPLPAFTTPAAYVALGTNGMGGAPGKPIIPAACAATDFPGFFEEYRYGVAAQEVGHGDFTSSSLGIWHACGPGELASYPKYKNARKDEYYKGSIGQFGLDTSKLIVKDPVKVSDFMGYTYCDRWTADPVGEDIILIRASTIKIGESSPLPDETNLIAKGISGEIKARGLTFKLEAFTPGTSARLPEATISIVGTATAGDLFVQIDNRPTFPAVTLTAGQSIKDIRDALAGGLNDQPGVDIQEREPFSAFPWVSPFTYNTMFPLFRDALILKTTFVSTMGVTAPNSAVPEIGQREYLIMAGNISSDNQVTLDPFYRMMMPNGTSDDIGTGNYSLELQDQSGQVLFVRHFDPNPAHPVLPQVRRFYQTVPLAPGIARIVFKQGDNILAMRIVSANSPSVTVVFPNGGEEWGVSGEQVIQWVASDADGDTLNYLVQYSKDAGQNWLTLATDLTDNKLTVNTAFLPGSNQSLVRVFATDGVNTGQDQSDMTFTVAKKDPTIWITGIENNAVVEPGAVVNLQANFVDPDEEPIDEQAFVWSSDKAGVLGNGSRLELKVAQLPPGAHRISLTVPGEQGQPITASVKILRAPLLQEVEMRAGNISGKKFNDINGNKIRDSGEVGLANWTIRLKGFDTLTRTTVDRTAITDINGNYSFTNLTPGFYVVYEMVKPGGWVPTTSVTVPVNLKTGESINVNFGNRKLP